MVFEDSLVGGFGPSGDNLDGVISGVLLDLGGEIFSFWEEGLFFGSLEIESPAIEHRLHADANVSDVLRMEGLQSHLFAGTGFRVEENMS